MSSDFTLDLFGLIRNPFDPAPLEPTDSDMQLFVGRSSEIDQIRTLLASTPGGLYRVVVMGAYGVGKTSFVNRTLWEAKRDERHRFATIKLVAKEDMTYLVFLLTFMSKLLEILADEKDLISSERKAVEEVKLNLEYEREIGLEETSEVSGSIGGLIATIAGKLGVAESEVRRPRRWTEMSAIGDVGTLVRIALGHYNALVVAIDECDYLASPVASEVLKKGREEIFQQRNFMFIFSGTMRFRALLDDIGSPIREIIDRFFILEAFRYPQESNILDELVDLRLRYAAKDGVSYKNPFDKQSMDHIFALSSGVPRRILRFLQSSLDVGLAKRTNVTPQIVLAAIRDLGRAHYVGLNIQQRDIVKLLARKELSGDPDFVEIRTKFHLSEKEWDRTRRGLESQGLLNPTVVGRELLYSLAPELRVFVLHDTKLAQPILQIEAGQRIRQTGLEEQDEKAKRNSANHANLLEAQGHLGLLMIEYKSMSKNEKLSHCDKVLDCIRDISDPKLDSSIGYIQSARAGIQQGSTLADVGEVLGKAHGKVKDYAKSIFEPKESTKIARVVLRSSSDRGEFELPISEDVTLRTLMLYESIIREMAANSQNRDWRVRWRASSKTKVQKRGAISRITDFVLRRNHKDKSNK
jgi:hypothetical protein